MVIHILIEFLSYLRKINFVKINFRNIYNSIIKNLLDNLYYSLILQVPTTANLIIFDKNYYCRYIA